MSHINEKQKRFFVWYQSFEENIPFKTSRSVFFAAYLPEPAEQPAWCTLQSIFFEWTQNAINLVYLLTFWVLTLQQIYHFERKLSCLLYINKPGHLVPRNVMQLSFGSNFTVLFLFNLLRQISFVSLCVSHHHHLTPTAYLPWYHIINWHASVCTPSPLHTRTRPIITAVFSCCCGNMLVCMAIS
jgi:hypothetical protein